MKLNYVAAMLVSLVVLSGSTGLDRKDSSHRVAPMQPDMGCTVVYATDGDVALGGNNEDYGIPNTKAYFLPAEEGKYGRVYFGFENFIWSGGMNDQGLFFDAMAVDQPVSVPRGEKSLYEGTVADKAMAECATVDCVLALFEQYHEYNTWFHQFLFGDAAGSSVIIEPLAVLRNDGSYQVGTNFYQSTTPENQRTCPRYRRATGLLKNAETISVDLMREVMDATHLEGDSQTLYSNVYDLANRIAYVYYFHDFEHEVALDLEEELAKGTRVLDLASLFPPNPEAERWAAPIVSGVEQERASRTTVNLDSLTLEQYVGRYDIPEEMHSSYPYPFFGVVLDGDGLILQVKTDKAWYPLTPQSENEFFHLSVRNDFGVAFERDEAGSVENMVYREGGREYVLPRMVVEDAMTPTPTPTQPAAAAVAATPAPRLDETGAGPNYAARFGPALALFAVGLYMVWRGVRRRLTA